MTTATSVETTGPEAAVDGRSLEIVTTRRTDTREALLEAAIEVIEADGDSGFRISAVLDRVGVASTAIYHHFGSRDDLVDSANAERYLRTLFIPGFDRVADDIRACTSVEQFDAIVDAIASVGGDPGATPRRRARVAVLGSAVSRPSLAAKVGEANATYAREMARVFRPAQERGWIRADLDLEAAAIWVIGQSTGRIMLELGDPGFDVAHWSAIEHDAVVAMVTGRSGGPSPR